MGLDCYIRKLSKAEVVGTYSSMAEKLSPRWGDKVRPERLLQVPVAQPLSLVKGYWAPRNDIGYWRKWHSLNRWMGELAHEKAPSITPDQWRVATFDGFALNGAPVLLNEEDVERLRLEVLFGGLWKEYMEYWGDHDSEFDQKLFGELLETLDRAKRIIRRNASLVFYVGSL
jgi:hypothetical protein